MQARTVSVTINRPAAGVYDYLADATNFPRWSQFLTSMRPDGADWIAGTPEGDVRIRFAERNQFGIVDHHVTVPTGAVVYVPFRVVANGQDAEVLFTIFRLADMTDERFEADVAMVQKDLGNLRQALGHQEA